jgi:hypothetical protein
MKSISLLEQKVGPINFMTLKSYLNLGTTYLAIGRYFDAKVFIEKAFFISFHLFQFSSIETIRALILLAEVFD